MSDDVLKILAFFNQITSLETLMAYCLEHNYLVHHEDLMRYLAMQKDDEAAQKYMLKIKEKLDSIAANALRRYTEKMEQLKAEYRD
jgi:S-adenosylmethionine:diacylglycerol 3-amino-3-carboxypropyl transferase